MHKIIVLVMAALGCGLFCGCANKGLKDAYASDFRIGAAVNNNIEARYTPAEIQLIKDNFNAVTPEQCMKIKQVHPAENQWRFGPADELMNFAQKNHMDVFGHTLVWQDQVPDWFFKDGDKPASRELALARLKTHIFTLVGRYKGRIRGWDVVNEAISDNKDEFLRDSPWLKIIGPDFIVQAFRFAHEADPTAELQYNDYGVEWPVRLPKVLKILQELKDNGIKVTSVGIQGHWQLDHVPYENIATAIDTLSKAGVMVSFTELDIDILPRATEGSNARAKEASSVALRQKKPEPADVTQRQAEQYARLFELFKRHKSQIERVTFWGVDDAHTWLNGWPMRRYNHPLLWDRNAQPKAAFYAVMKAAK